jgi:hypothetical protein
MFLGLCQELLLRKTDTLHQAPIADRLPVHANWDQFWMLGKIGAKGLELHTGGNPHLGTSIKCSSIKAVKPNGVRSRVGQAIDHLNRVTSIRAKE